MRLPWVFAYYLAASSGFCPLTQTGLIAAASLSTAPLVLSDLGSVLGALDPAFGQAARSLGASDWLVFSRVQLPLVFRPVLGAAASAFLSVLAELALCWWLFARGAPS